jgi:hypothetical protein
VSGCLRAVAVAVDALVRRCRTSFLSGVYNGIICSTECLCSRLRFHLGNVSGSLFDVVIFDEPWKESAGPPDEELVCLGRDPFA